MRILHTADWHLGKPLHGRSRYKESSECLNEIINICDSKNVDMVVAAGDIFDSFDISPDSEALVVGFCRHLADINVPVCLVPGNHDPAKRWQIRKSLYRRINCFVSTEPQTIEVIGLKVGMLPWMTPNKLLEASGKRIHDIIRAHCNNHDLVVGHLMVNNAIVSGTERPITLRDSYAVAPDCFRGAGYVALGHIHVAQAMSPNSRYSGPLFQLDFGEINQPRGVFIVDLDSNAKKRKIGFAPLTSGMRLRDISGTWDEVEQQTMERDEMVRVTVNHHCYDPSLNELAKSKFPHALVIRVNLPKIETPAMPALIKNKEFRTEKFDSNMFIRYYKSRHGMGPTKALMNTFRGLRIEVGNGKDE